MSFKSLVVPFLKRIENKIARNVDYTNVETELGRDFRHNIILIKKVNYDIKTQKLKLFFDL